MKPRSASSAANLARQVTVEVEECGRVGLAEMEIVQVEQPGELGYGHHVVVDA